jgi:hypothetical protein
MPRRVFPLLACIALVAAACSDDGSPNAGAGADPPAAVPDGARIVSEPTAVGALAVTPGADDPHLYFGTRCADGLLAVTTTRETVYAELPCDRALPPEAAARFLGQPVLIRIVPSEPAKLYIESTAAGSAEFTVGRVWIETR